MPAALGTHPELLGPPRHAGSRIAHVHLGATPLAADVEASFVRWIVHGILQGVDHGAILAQEGFKMRS